MLLIDFSKFSLIFFPSGIGKISFEDCMDSAQWFG